MKKYFEIAVKNGILDDSLELRTRNINNFKEFVEKNEDLLDLFNEKAAYYNKSLAYSMILYGQCYKLFNESKFSDHTLDTHKLVSRFFFANKKSLETVSLAEHPINFVENAPLFTRPAEDIIVSDDGKTLKSIGKLSVFENVELTNIYSSSDTLKDVFSLSRIVFDFKNAGFQLSFDVVDGKFIEPDIFTEMLHKTMMFLCVNSFDDEGDANAY